MRLRNANSCHARTSARHCNLRMSIVARSFCCRVTMVFRFVQMMICFRQRVLTGTAVHFQAGLDAQTKWAPADDSALVVNSLVVICIVSKSREHRVCIESAHDALAPWACTQWQVAASTILPHYCSHAHVVHALRPVDESHRPVGRNSYRLYSALLEA